MTDELDDKPDEYYREFAISTVLAPHEKLFRSLLVKPFPHALWSRAFMKMVDRRLDEVARLLMTPISPVPKKEEYEHDDS